VTHPNAILKAAAVGCSVLLAAGFVSYRAGAFDWLNPPPNAEPTSTPPAESVTAPPAEPTQAKSELVPPAILYSSKSGAIVPAPAPSTGAPSPAIIGGSKSIAPLIPPSPPPAQKPASPPNESGAPK
jgi:hypothetical protein